MIVLCLLLWSCIDHLAADIMENIGPSSLNVTDGELKKGYNGTVGGGDYQQTNVYFFHVPKDRLAYVEPKVDRHSWNSTIDYPLSVNAWSTMSSISFLMPLILEGKRYYEARRFLCPTNTTMASDVYVSISSASPEPENYRLIVGPIEKGTFNINVLDKKITDFSVGPAWPEHFQFNFPVDVDAVDIVLTAFSDHPSFNMPAIMMIQEAKCPLLATSDEIEKAHRTVVFVQHARVTLLKSRSYPSVFLNFVSTRNETVYTQKKKIHLTITKSGSTMSYGTPIIGAIGISAIIFLLPLIYVIGFKVTSARREHLGGGRLIIENEGEIVQPHLYNESQGNMAQSRDQLVGDPEAHDQSPVYPPTVTSGRTYWLDIVHYPKVIAGLASVTIIVVFAIMLAISASYEKTDQCYFNHECLRYTEHVSAFNHVFSYAFAYTASGLSVLFFTCLLACSFPGNVDGESSKIRPVVIAAICAILAQGFISSAFESCPTRFLHFTENGFLILALLVGTAALYGPLSVNVVMAVWIPLIVLSAVAETSQFGKAGRVLALLMAICFPIILTFVHIRYKLATEHKSYRQLLNEPEFYVIVVWCLAQSGSAGLIHHTIDTPTFVTCSTVIFTLVFFLIHVFTKRGDKSSGVLFCIFSFALIGLLFWIIGMIYYLRKQAEFMAPPSYSRSKNGPCILWSFYDNGDLWAFFSAYAVFYQYMAFLFYKSV